MAHGFICESGDVTGISTTFALANRVTLGANTSRDGLAKASPAGAYWSHLDIKATVTAGAPTTISAYLTWDSAGDEPASGLAATQTLISGLTTTTVRFVSIGLDVWPRIPTGASAGTVYLWTLVDAGTITVTKARLHWRDNLGSG